MGLFKKLKSIFSARGWPALGRKPKARKPKKPKKPVKKPIKKLILKPKKKVEVAKPEVKKPPAKRPPVKRKDLREIYKVLKEPHISEKATVLAEENKYIFKVYSQTNKIETKKAIENLYGVKVKDVNIINVHRKRRILRGIKGFKSGYKKAVVTLKEGEKIEIIPR